MDCTILMPGSQPVADLGPRRATQCGAEFVPSQPLAGDVHITIEPAAQGVGHIRTRDAGESGDIHIANRDLGHERLGVRDGIRRPLRR